MLRLHLTTNIIEPVKMFSIEKICRFSTTFKSQVWATSRYIKHRSLLNQTIQRNFYISHNLAAKVAFNLSDIGEGIREVIVKEWYVKVGDKVNQFDQICEVQSDKASVTITSRYDGIVSKLYHNVDDIALVGKPLVDIETEEERGEELLQQSIDSTEVEQLDTDTKESNAKDVLQEYLVKSEDILESSQEHQTSTLCIPSVRRLAKEHKINLSTVKGTGKGGRVLKEDILDYITEKPLAKQPTTTTRATTEPIKGFAKVMVKTMTESSKIPLLIYGDEIKVTRLSELRRSLRELAELKDLKLSFMPFFVKAVSNALQHYPVINSSVDEHCENITYHKHHNIGIAVDTKAGLAVPVIKAVETLSIVEIATELNRLIESGRNGTFSPSDLVDGTFTISNIGSIGGTYVKPLILPPQVAIIALGASQVLPRFDENKNVIAEEIVNVSGGADHRIIDGATMAKFTKVVKRQIENPYLLFLNL